MRIIGALIYFLLFLVLSIVSLFLGGLSGVVGAFYLLVEQGDLLTNIVTVVAILSLLWLLLTVLSYYNEKAMKKNKLLKQEAAAQVVAEES